MPKIKRDQIKIYIVIGLALVMVILGYFRFIHKKAASDKGHPPVAPSDTKLDIPVREIKGLQNDYWHKRPTDEPLGTVKRDIFVTVNSLNEAENGSVGNRPSNPASTLKLRGTIVGGKNPIAIINNKFVRIGDWINEYKLVMIGKNEVLLALGNKKIKVEMLESGEK